MVDQLRPRRVLRHVDVARLEQRAQLGLVAGPEALLGERVDELHAAPRRGEVDLLALELDLRRPEHLERGVRHELLDAVHRVVVVGVRLVPLEHRELVRVLERDALVAEVLADLVHLLETADDQALQVELGRDAQVVVRVERVPVGDERLGKRAAVPRLQDRRLHLDEAPAVERAADRRDDARADERDLARVLVHQQVEVALPIALLDVGETVERVGKRRVDAREHLERVDLERRLASSRLRRRADDADDVAEMHVDLARALDRAEQLDPPAAVDEVEEDELAHVAARHHAAGEAALRVGGCAVVEWLSLGANARDLVAVGEALRRGHDPRV